MHADLRRLRFTKRKTLSMALLDAAMQGRFLRVRSCVLVYLVGEEPSPVESTPAESTLR